MAEIRFLPVCSECGEVIYNTDISYEEAPCRSPLPQRMAFVYRGICPPMCPHCLARFDAIIIPTKLPFEAKRGHRA